DHVTKRYGPTLAVDDVSFEIGRGEIVGFLGPNGAGKSTLLKMMCTWLPPTSGSIAIAGHDVEKESLAVRRTLGYLPEHNALYDVMRVDRFLRFIGRARGLRGSELADRIGWAVERCALQEVQKKRIQQCSKGYRQRIGVAAALLHNPPVILLDEPTHGLDPLQVVAFLDFVQGLSEGRAIIFSTHILSEVTAISGRILIISHGKLLADSPTAELKKQAAEEQKGLEEKVLDIVRSGGAAL
ncbi:MAG: ATP-binding cassette domain-containing protein, partial [Planctomycetota bacterium]|nr:ATP-binding cassette domain-containing protein [Planctomycetota bacterium]